MYNLAYLDLFNNNSLLDTIQKLDKVPVRSNLPINLIEEQDKFVVEAKVNTLDKDSIHIELINNNLSITVDTNKQLTKEGGNNKPINFILNEFKYKEVKNRTISLSKTCNLNTELKAELNNGILTIEIPKLNPQSQEPKKIPIS
jgi:HSP20 family molecular chaperone IbpA